MGPLTCARHLYCGPFLFFKFVLFSFIAINKDKKAQKEAYMTAFPYKGLGGGGGEEVRGGAGVGGDEG
jgi:hypothetical protein